MQVRVHSNQPFEVVPWDEAAAARQAQEDYEATERRCNPLLPRTKVAFDRRVEEVQDGEGCYGHTVVRGREGAMGIWRCEAGRVAID